MADKLVSPMISKQLAQLDLMSAYFTGGSLTKDQYEAMTTAVYTLIFKLNQTQRTDRAETIKDKQ